MFKRIEGKDLPPKRGTLVYVFFCAIIILFGLLGMFFLTNMKETPEKVCDIEPYIKVRTVEANPENHVVNLLGHGRVKPVSEMSLASEIGGKIVFANPNLKSGCIIHEGDVLVKIDDMDCIVDVLETEVYVDQCLLLISKLKKEQEVDIRRIDGLKRNKMLTQNEFQKTKRLFEEYSVGNEVDVNNIEKKYNVISDQVDEMLKIISLYPLQIKHAESELKAARARLMRANANLKKCEIVVPVSSRVKSSSVENGELLSPGQEIAVLVNDSQLEIEVSLDSGDVKKWIEFDNNHFDKSSWFSKLQPVSCKITWGGKDCFCEWSGHLSRVSEFDEKTHTIKVVVEIDTDCISEKSDIFPIVEGMFCTVSIPGKTMKKVYCLPREAVDFEGRVCLVDQNSRLKTAFVNIIRSEGDNLFVKGLNPRDLVITTRLVDPLDGMLVKIDDEIVQKG